MQKEQKKKDESQKHTCWIFNAPINNLKAVFLSIQMYDCLKRTTQNALLCIPFLHSSKKMKTKFLLLSCAKQQNMS